MSASAQSYQEKLAGMMNRPGDELLAVRELLSRGDRKIYLHGAGNFGSAACKLLEDAGFAVAGFIDRSAAPGDSHLGKPLFAAASALGDQFDKERDIVVLGFICNRQALNSVRSAYQAQGYRNVLYFLNLYALFITGKLAADPSRLFRVTPAVGIRFGQVRERMLRVGALWQDRESRDTYQSFVEAILSGDSESFAPPSSQPQYFVDDIPFRKGYSRFIDCGAFDGDTALALKQHKGKGEAIACFEPDQNNYLLLSRRLNRERAASEQILFPCGVWQQSEMLRFRSGQQSTSGISEGGDTFLQCVSIDQAIPDFGPTFVKMDVEGAEYEALLGAERTLSACRPDLAISVYHRIEHMWEIPLLIQENCGDYRFYLRSHGEYGVETIMYATGS